MSNPVVLVGNPNPPGVPVAPGAPMPPYQALPGTTWNPPMGGAPAPDPITKHTGELANWFVTSHHVAKPWSNGYHEMIREGQIIFIARTANEDDEMQNQVNLQQLNHMMREGYKRAVAAMDPANPFPMPEGLTSAAEAHSVVYGDIPTRVPNTDVAGGDLPGGHTPGIGESELEEYLGRPAALEEEVPPGEYKNRLKTAIELAKASNFRYLTAAGIMHRWNFWGVVNNISVGTSPEGKVRASQSHRKYSPTVVINCIVAKKVYVSNIWGHKDKVAEGNTLYLILRRKVNDRGEYGPFEFVPYSHTNVDGVPLSETVYNDVAGYVRYGPVIPMGTCTEVANRPPAEHKRRQAIGNGQSVSLATAHDALGSLPQIVVQMRV